MKSKSQSLSGGKEEEGDSKNESVSGSCEPGPEGAPEQSISDSCSTVPISCTADTDIAPSDLSQSSVDEPRQPLLWCYSAIKVKQDHLFCFATFNFQETVVRRQYLPTDGCQNWKKATSSFKTHNASVEYKYAVAARNESGSAICNALKDG